MGTATLRRIILWAAAFFAVLVVVHVIFQSKSSLATDVAAMAAAAATIVLALINVEVLTETQRANRAQFIPTLAVETASADQPVDGDAILYAESPPAGLPPLPLRVANAGPGVLRALRVEELPGARVLRLHAPLTLAPGQGFRLRTLCGDGSAARLSAGRIVFSYEDVLRRRYRLEAYLEATQDGDGSPLRVTRLGALQILRRRRREGV